MHHLVRDHGKGEAVHVWGQGTHGKPLQAPLNFAVDLKLL